MKNLDELVTHIHSIGGDAPFIGIDVAVWDSIRQEARERCADHDQELMVHPTMTTPNFLVSGIPIIQAGHA